MGRPESPLERDGTPAREMAFWLRDLRNRSGLTYGQLARRTGFSASTLQEALSGRRIPTRQVTLAIVEACEGDLGGWDAYWAQVRRAGDPDAPAGLEASLIPPWLASQAQAEPQAADHASTGDTVLDAEESLATATLGTRRLRGVWLPIVAAVMVAGVVVGLILHLGLGTGTAASQARDASSSHPPGQNRKPDQVKTYREEEYNRNGAVTFRFLDASGPGQPLEFQEFVQISCKVYAPGLPSSRPDGYWYRIASFPWDNHYYAVANTFLNGDPAKGPYTHNVDWRVPNCRS